MIINYTTDKSNITYNLYKIQILNHLYDFIKPQSIIKYIQ